MLQAHYPAFCASGVSRWIRSATGARREPLELAGRRLSDSTSSEDSGDTVVDLRLALPATEDQEDAFQDAEEAPLSAEELRGAQERSWRDHLSVGCEVQVYSRIFRCWVTARVLVVRERIVTVKFADYTNNETYRIVSRQSCEMRPVAADHEATPVAELHEVRSRAAVPPPRAEAPPAASRLEALRLTTRLTPRLSPRCQAAPRRPGGRPRRKSRAGAGGGASAGGCLAQPALTPRGTCPVQQALAGMDWFAALPLMLARLEQARGLLESIQGGGSAGPSRGSTSPRTPRTGSAAPLPPEAPFALFCRRPRRVSAGSARSRRCSSALADGPFKQDARWPEAAPAAARLAGQEPAWAAGCWPPRELAWEAGCEAAPLPPDAEAAPSLGPLEQSEALQLEPEGPGEVVFECDGAWDWPLSRREKASLLLSMDDPAPEDGGQILEKAAGDAEVICAEEVWPNVSGTTPSGKSWDFPLSRAEKIHYLVLLRTHGPEARDHASWAPGS